MRLPNDESIRRVLEGFSKAKRGALAVLSAEWLMPYFCECCFWQGDRNIEYLTQAIDRLWDAVVGMKVLSNEDKENFEQRLPSLFFPDPSAPPARVITTANASRLIGVLNCAFAALSESGVDWSMKAVSYITLFLEDFVIARDLRWNVSHFTIDKEVRRNIRERLERDPLFRSYSDFNTAILKKLEVLPESLSLENCSGLREDARKMGFKLPDALDVEPEPPLASTRMNLDQYNEKSLLPFLEKAHVNNRVLFAAFCCERLAGIDERYSGTKIDKNKRLGIVILDRVWRHLAGEAFRPDELQSGSETVGQKLQEIGDTTSDVAVYAKYFFSALRHTLETVESGSVETSLRAARSACDLVRASIVKHYKIDTTHADSWKRILRHPLYELERNRQWSDGFFVSKAKAKIDASYLDALRAQGKREALKYFGDAEYVPQSNE